MIDSCGGARRGERHHLPQTLNRFGLWPKFPSPAAARFLPFPLYSWPFAGGSDTIDPVPGVLLRRLLDHRRQPALVPSSVLGSARVSRVGLGILAETNFSTSTLPHQPSHDRLKKVRF